MRSFSVSCAVVNPVKSQHEQAGGEMSCFSMANLRVRFGWDCPRLAAPFKIFISKGCCSNDTIQDNHVG